MEKISHYSGRVNHAGFWDSVATVLTVGVSDLVKGEAKDSRAKIEKREYEILVKGLIYFYENPTASELPIPTTDGTITLYRSKFLSDSNLPAVMIDKTVTPVKPTYAAYIWAQVQSGVIFSGMTPAQAEARTGNVIKFTPVEFGKMDWNTIIKQAGVMIVAMVGTVVTGGIAAPAAIGAVKTVFDIQKSADALTHITPLVTPAIASAQEQAAKAAAAQQAIADQNKLASFLSFENPYFIMGSMALAVIVLYFVSRKHSVK